MTLIPLELVCFGAPQARLVGRDTPPELRWHKHLALLVYLALSPGGRRSRDHLLGLLWGDQPDRGARKALNTAVNRLRIALGSERLRSENDFLALSEDVLEVDALRLLSGVAPEATLPLLRGDFLEGFHVKEAPEFEDWMMRERERYRALAVATFVNAGESLLGTNGARAADLARRALGLVPTSEPAVRLLMRAAALGGDSPSALTAYSEFARRLHEGLGERPPRALVALAERIRAQTWRPAGTDTTLSVPLVGRDALHRTLFNFVGGVTSQRRANALAIVSPPGMGRSRLLAECAQRLALDGTWVLQVRPVKNDQDSRWSLLRLLMSAGITALPGLAGARPDSLAVLAALQPELAERFSPREPKDVADMATALANALAAAAEEQPIALAIDDAQWSDGSSLAALGAAWAQLKQSAVTLLFTVAHGVTELPSELLTLESELGRAIPGLVVRLSPLADVDIAQLVESLAPWCRGSEERSRLSRRLTHETGGSPFFAVTLLGALARPSNFQKDMVAWPPPGGTIDAPLPFSVPAVARHAIAVRIGELPATTLHVLSAASVLGQSLDIDLIARIVQRSPSDVERLLPECERRHLIMYDGQRYTFAAPLIGEVIREECVTRGERRVLERRAIDVLGTREDLESRALRVELLARVAPDQTAFEKALNLSEDAARADARRVLERALNAAERIQQDAKLDPTPLIRSRDRLLPRPSPRH